MVVKPELVALMRQLANYVQDACDSDMTKTAATGTQRIGKP